MKDMKSILMLALAGGAVWWYLRQQSSESSTDGKSSLTAADLQKLVEDAVKKAGGTTTGGGTTGATKTTAEKFLAAAGNPSELNAHEWSYFRPAVGLDPLTPETFGEKFGDGMTKMSIAEYLTKLGLSGLSAVSRGARMRPMVIYLPQLRRVA